MATNRESSLKEMICSIPTPNTAKGSWTSKRPRLWGIQPGGDFVDYNLRASFFLRFEEEFRLTAKLKGLYIFRLGVRFVSQVFKESTFTLCLVDR